MTEDKGYYSAQLEDGAEYQDFVSDILRKRMNICVGLYTSKKYQFKKGESQSGIEIKHDKKLCDTGNIFIEVAEKNKAEDLEWIPSGIYRNDNSWLYLIGDYDQMFIFSKKQLIKIVENETLRKKHRMEFKTIQRGTSQGYTLPTKVALSSGLCLKHIVIKEHD